jgi:hypothetical protein
MEKEKINEVLSIMLGVLSVFAIGGKLIQNDFTIDSIFDSVVNFSQVAVPVLAILVISIGMRKINETYLFFLENEVITHQKPVNVAGALKVASFKDPWNNVFGFIYNPDFKLSE